MSNKDKIKKSISDDFNKDINYNEIINNIEKENNIMTKKNVYKWSLVPICLVIGFVIFNICILNKSKNYDNKKVNNGIEKIDNNIKKNIVDESKIYNTIEYSYFWAFDVSNPKLIAEDADYIIKVKVLGIEDSTYKYSPNFDPTTPIKVETLSILKGDKNVNINQILKWGGIVTIEEYIKNSPITSIEKMGLNKLSDEEKKTKYMKIEEPGNYDLEIGKTYVVNLIENENGNLFIGANGYSVFEVIGVPINEKYKNVLTGNELILD